MVLVDDREVEKCTTHDKSDITDQSCSTQSQTFHSQDLNTPPDSTGLQTDVTIMTQITSITSPVAEVCQQDNIPTVSTTSKRCSIMTDNDIQPTGTDIDVEVKREEVEIEIACGTRLKRFSLEEDSFLKEGIRKYGIGRWSHMLRDTDLKFHPSRTRDSLRVRADTIGITNTKKKRRKQYELR